MRNGIDRDAAQASRQRRETADSQTFTLGPNILAVTLERKRISDIVISTKETKRQQEFNTLRGKVLTLKE